MTFSLGTTPRRICLGRGFAPLLRGPEDWVQGPEGGYFCRGARKESERTCFGLAVCLCFWVGGWVGGRVGGWDRFWRWGGRVGKGEVGLVFPQSLALLDECGGQ